MTRKVDDASREYNQLTGELKKLAKALEGGTKKVKNMDKAVQGGVTGVRNLRNQVKGLTDRVKEQNKEVPKGTTAWAAYGRQLSIIRSRMLIVAFAARMVQKAIGTLLELNQKQFVSELKLESVLRSTGHASKMSGTELRNMASEMSHLALVSDDLIIDAQAIMLTFTQIGRDVFPDAIKQAMNMSVIFGQDLKQSVIQVGKALNDPITGVGALRRIGVSFNETQKDQIKGFMAINDLASAQRVILEELAREMGGVAEKMKDAPLSGWQRGWMDIQDAMEGVGSALGNLIYPLEIVFEALGRSIKRFDEWDARVTGETQNKALKERQALIDDITKSTIAENTAYVAFINQQGKLVTEVLGRGTLKNIRDEMDALSDKYEKGGMKANEYTKEHAKLNDELEELARKLGFFDIKPAQTEIEKLSKFMEKFRSKDLDDEMNFQLAKAEALKASEENLKTIRDHYQALKDDSDQIAATTKKYENQFAVLDTVGLANKELVKVSQDLFGSNTKLTTGLDEQKAKYNQIITSQGQYADNQKRISDLTMSTSSRVLGANQAEYDLANELMSQKRALTKERVGLLDWEEKANDQFTLNLVKGKIAQKDADIALINSQLVKIRERTDMKQKLQDSELAEIELLKKKNEAILNGIDLTEEQLASLKAEIDQNQALVDSIEQVIAKKQEDALKVEAAQQLSDTLGTFNDLEIERINKLMQADIEATKQTSAYKRAQKRGDNVAMAKLEKDAMKATFPERKRLAQQKLALGVADIGLSTTVAMMKAYKDYGFPGGALIMGLIASIGAMQTAAAIASNPIPKFARGGDFVTTGPQNILVGDNPGGRERVQVTPLSSPNIDGPQGGSVTVNVSGNVLSQDFVEGELAENIKEAIRRGTDFGIS